MGGKIFSPHPRSDFNLAYCDMRALCACVELCIYYYLGWGPTVQARGLSEDTDVAATTRAFDELVATTSPATIDCSPAAGGPGAGGDRAAVFAAWAWL